MLGATVESILESGFYRASTNAIARRAGVSWGVLQHYFGTRETLLLEVVKDSAEHFISEAAQAHVDGATPEDRLEQLTEILAGYYGQPEYLAVMQILLNLDHDPETSDVIRATMRDTAKRSNSEVRRLLHEALPGAEHLDRVVFIAVRGFVLGQLLHTTLTGGPPTKPDELAAERRRFAGMLAASLEA